MKAILVHGSYGSPDENWFPWLKAELEKLGFEVFAPKFPGPERQSLENWLREFRECQAHLGPQTILIGHSLGCAFILSVIERAVMPLKAAFLVSGFTGRLGDPKFDVINSTFAERNFDWNKIRSMCSSFTIFHSDNDPYVPEDRGRELASNLNAEFVEIKDAGHFNKDSGYAEFPELLKRIRELLLL